MNKEKIHSIEEQSMHPGIYLIHESIPEFQEDQEVVVIVVDFLNISNPERRPSEVLGLTNSQNEEMITEYYLKGGE